MKCNDLMVFLHQTEPVAPCTVRIQMSALWWGVLTSVEYLKSAHCHYFAFLALKRAAELNIPGKKSIGLNTAQLLFGNFSA